MITLLAVILLIFAVSIVVGIGYVLVAISPILAIIICLPLIDLLVFKLIKWIKENKE